MTKNRLTALIIRSTMTLACISAPLPVLGGPLVAALGPDQNMVAVTWYGDHHRGRRTAGGETFDPNDHTAAHASLPLGTLVELTALNGRSVVVRINDRSPGPTTAIDVSRAAAGRLGIIGLGRAPARIEVIGRAD